MCKYVGLVHFQVDRCTGGVLVEGCCVLSNFGTRMDLALHSKVRVKPGGEVREWQRLMCMSGSGDR